MGYRFMICQWNPIYYIPYNSESEFSAQCNSRVLSDKGVHLTWKGIALYHIFLVFYYAAQIRILSHKFAISWLSTHFYSPVTCTWECYYVESTHVQPRQLFTIM